MNETGATLDVPVEEDQGQNPDAGSTPTAPAPVTDFVKWRADQNQPPEAGPDLSSISIVRPAEEMPDLTSVKKLPVSFDIPNEDHEWVRDRAMQRLAENPNDTRAAEALHMQQVVGMLPDDRPPAHDLPDWKPEQQLDLTTGVEPTPLLENENRDLDRYVEKMRPHAHEKTREIAERLIAAHQNGHASLPPDYIAHLVHIIEEGNDPQKMVDKALKGMQQANWQGVKESAVGAAKTLTKAALEHLAVESDEEAADDPEAAARNLKHAEEIEGGTAGGFVKMGAALWHSAVGAASYARFKTGFYSPEDREKAIIAGIQMDHDINIAKKTAFPDADETSPVSEVADFTGAMLVPGIGLEGVITKPLGKLASKAVETLPANVGKDMMLIGRAGKTIAPALAAEELYRRGYNPLCAAAALLGYAPLIQRAKLNIMDRAFGGMSELGNTLAHIPEGVTVVRKIQQDIDKDISYYRGLAQAKRQQFEGKIGDVDKTLGDGQRIRTAQLSGPDLEIRQLEDQAEMLQRRRDFLNTYADWNKIASDGAKIGLTATGLTAITGPVLGALSAANALPSEVEQAAKKGTESGLLIGAAGSLPQAIHGFRALRFERGRDAMMKRGEGKLTPEQLAGLTPEQQQAAQVMAGWHDVMGRTYNPISRADAAKLLNIKPEDVPPGWQDGDQSVVLKDRIPRGVGYHELTHHAQEILGQMLRDKDPQTMKVFGTTYDDLMKKSGRTRSTSVQSERDAEVGRILLMQTPIEMFYGGESGGDVIRRRLSTFLQDRFPNLFDRTQIDPVLGAPYSPSDLREMRARYARLGEMAAGQGATPQARSKGSVLSADHQAIADTVTAAVNQQFKVNPNDKANAGRNQKLVSQAILNLQQRGEPITQEAVFKEVMTPRSVPIAAQPAQGTKQNKIVGPALVDSDGKTILAQGVVGQTHEQIYRRELDANAGHDENQIKLNEAMGNDAQHVFVDEAGQPHDREAAADVAKKAGQVANDVTKLQSQHLQPKAPADPAAPAPVAEFEKWRQAQQGIAADPLSGLTTQEVAAMHRAQERGDIKNDEDLKKWIEQRTAGDRGAKLHAVKQFQESGQPFKVTFTKADGSERVANGLFGVTEHPVTGEKLVKGTRTKLPENPAIYTYFDTDKNEYRTFDIDRVKSIEDAQGVKKFMPEGNDSRDVLRVDEHGKNIVWERGPYFIAVDDPQSVSYVTLWKDGKRIGSLSTRSHPGNNDYLGVSGIDIKKSDQGQGLGTQMYRELLKFADPKYKGIASYLPDRSNKRQIPAIYKKLGGTVEGDMAIIPREKFMPQGDSPTESNEKKWDSLTEEERYQRLRSNYILDATLNPKPFREASKKTAEQLKASGEWETAQRVIREQKFMPEGERPAEAQLDDDWWGGQKKPKFAKTPEEEEAANREAERYFAIGQSDDAAMENNLNWIWDQSSRAIKAKQGGTHGSNFGHDVAGRTFKGWFDKDSGKISVVFPESELRRLDRKPTTEDIPQSVYAALQRKFGKTAEMVAFMPESDSPEKRFGEKIKGPAIRVADIPFTGKTYGEAEKAARDFGFEPNEIKNAERGYVTNKGAWKTPDEASSFAAEREQMGKQAEEGPLRTQDFNRWRKYMPEGDELPDPQSLGEHIARMPIYYREKGKGVPIEGRGWYEFQSSKKRDDWHTGRLDKVSHHAHLSNPKIVIGNEQHLGQGWKATNDTIEQAMRDGHDGIVVVDPWSLPDNQLIQREGEQYGKPPEGISEVDHKAFVDQWASFTGAEGGGKPLYPVTEPALERLADFVREHPDQVDWSDKFKHVVIPFDRESVRTYPPEPPDTTLDRFNRGDISKEERDRRLESRKFMPEGQEDHPQVNTPEFKKWFGESKVVDESGNPMTVFHGTARPDRIGSRFRKSRATAGPMAYFTDDPEIASNYAKGKADTSIEYHGDYTQWFKAKPKGSRAEVSLDKLWHHLSPEERAKLSENLPRVTGSDAEGEELPYGEFRLAEKGETGHYPKDHWEYTRRQHHGNDLRVAIDAWLESGSLFDREGQFMDVLKTAGMDTSKIRYDDPHATKSAVFPVFLSIKNPLDTSNIPESVVTALDEASGRRRGNPNDQQWSKTTPSGKEWVDGLRKDIAENTTHSWTAIPDWVSEKLKSLGYDGIKDTGGKFAVNMTKPHNVWIPFDETQVKSATGNRGTFDPESKNISFMPEGKVLPETHSLPDEKFYHGMTNPIISSGLTRDKSDSIARHNAKVEILNKLEDEGALTDDNLEFVRNWSPADVESALWSIGEKRNLQEIEAGHEGETEAGNFQTERPLFDWIKDEHPVTDDLATAGYALPNGDLLSFTHGAGKRDQDHREISWPGSAGGTEKMVAVMNAGAMRIDARSGHVSLRRPPTGAQERVIQDIIAHKGEAYIDAEIPDKDGAKWKARDSFQPRDEIDGEDAIKAIRAFYKSGGRNAKKFMPEGFYSQLEKVLDEKMPNKASADHVRGIIASGSVKKAELDWNSPLRDLLDRGGTLSKDQVLAAVRAGTPELKEIVRRGSTGNDFTAEVAEQYVNRGYHQEEADEMAEELERMPGPERAAAIERQGLLVSGDEGGEAHFAQYQLPGGENYREIAYTLPSMRKEEDAPPGLVEAMKRYGEDPTPENQAEYRRLSQQYEKSRRQDYEPPSGHYLPNNTVAHMRVNDRTLSDGKKMLFGEEFQSDWAATGRKEGWKSEQNWNGADEKRYQDLKAKIPATSREKLGMGGDEYEGSFLSDLEEAELDDLSVRRAHTNLDAVPDMPWKSSNAWQSLLMRSLIQKAVAEGKDAIGWATGAHQQERYDLSKHLESVRWYSNKDGSYSLFADAKDGGKVIEQEHIPAEELEKYIGKEVARKIINNEGEYTKDQRSRGALNAQRKTAGILEGLDLKVGGEWATNLYDKQLVNIANDIGKKYGAKVRDVRIDIGEKQAHPSATDLLREQAGRSTAHSLPITEALRQAVQSKGQPLFMPEGKDKGPAREPARPRQSRLTPSLGAAESSIQQTRKKRYSAFATP